MCNPLVYTVIHQFTHVNRQITHRQKTGKSWWSLGLGPSKVFHTKDQLEASGEVGHFMQQASSEDWDCDHTIADD